MVVFKKPATTKAPRDKIATRAAEGDVLAKLEMIKDEFEEIAMQVSAFDESEQTELKRKFSDVSEDIGEALC